MSHQLLLEFSRELTPDEWREVAERTQSFPNLANRTIWTVKLIPVPRCETCAHWGSEHDDGHWDAKQCAYLSQDFCCSGQIVQPAAATPDDPLSSDYLPPDFDAGATGGGSVETRPNFGCVQWKERT